MDLPENVDEVCAADPENPVCMAHMNGRSAQDTEAQVPKRHTVPRTAAHLVHNSLAHHKVEAVYGPWGIVSTWRRLATRRRPKHHLAHNTSRNAQNITRSRICVLPHHHDGS